MSELHMNSIYLAWHKAHMNTTAMQNQAADEIKALQQQLAKANDRVRELERDEKRLDLLDKCNADFNHRMGSNYGWRVDWNHNRIAIVDTGIPKTDVRTAIDDFTTRLQLRKEQDDD